MPSYLVGVDDPAVVSDASLAEMAIGGISTRKVYLRHQYGKPAYVVAHKDDAGMFTATMSQGRELPIPAGLFEGMRRERENIALMMDRGIMTASEDYLGSTRVLLPDQVATYVAVDQPWASWIIHRTVTGAPVVPDVSGPIPTTLGVFAQGFTRILVKVDMLGGAAPTVDITPWFRTITPTARGPWTFGIATTGIIDAQEYTLDVNGREVYLQITGVANAPTSVTISLSGCA